MIKVTIRIDEIGGVKDRLSSFLERYEKYLVYEEVSDVVEKLHYQGVVHVCDEKSYIAIKTRFSTYFKDIPKGGKSMAKVKTDSYEIYISKDKNPVFIKSYTDEEVKKLQELSYKKKNNPIVKKQTFIEIVDEKFDEWIVEVRKKSNRSDWNPHRNEIIRWLINTFSCMKKLWDVGVLTKYANYLQYKIEPSTLIRSVLEVMTEKY